MTPWYRSHLVPFILAVIAFMIITTGGWIRISDAGESCPDWPTCFGTWGFDVSPEEQEEWWEENPDEIDSRGENHRYTTYQIFTEWAHRGLVGIIGMLVLYSHYTAWSLKNEIGSRTYRTHTIATVFLVLQAILGYVTVDLDNAPWTVSLHLFMALMFTLALITVGLFWWEDQSGLPEYLKDNNQSSEIKSLIWYSLGILLVQLLLGAYLSTSYHRGACSVGFYEGWPLCNGKIVPSFEQVGVLIQTGHRFAAIIILGFLLWVRTRIKLNENQNIVSKSFDLGLGIYCFNLLLGGLYIVSAGSGNFSGALSLVHLLVGVATFITLAFTYLTYIVPKVES